MTGSRIVVNPDDMIDDTVTIPLDEYMQLQSEVKFLSCLEELGIEHWEGYQQAVQNWRNIG